MSNNPLTNWDPSGHGPFSQAVVDFGESLGGALGGASSMPKSMPGAPYPIVTPLKDPEGSDPYVDKKVLPNLPSAYTGQWEVSQPYITVDQQTATENSPTEIQQPVEDSSMYILASSSSPLQNGLALSKIAGKYGNCKCVEAAKAMKSYLTKNGLKGEQISIKYKGGDYIVSDSYENGTEAISVNGYHTGILYEGKVYDNIHKDGIPYEDWLDDFSGVGEREIKRDNIN